MALPVIVVGGIPVLSSALERSGQFPRVLTAADINGLKQLAVGPDLRGLRPADVVFILGDNLPADPSFPLSEFVRRVAGAGYRVLVVALTPAAIELQRNFPQITLLTPPLRLNDVMFALANFGFPVSPNDAGGAVLDLAGGGTNPGAAGKPVFFQTSGTGWSTPAESPGGGWQNPTEPSTQQPSTQPVNQQQRPQPAAPFSNPPVAPTPPPTQPQGWGSTNQTQDFGSAPQRPKSLADFAAGANQTPTSYQPTAQPTWGNPATAPSAGAPWGSGSGGYQDAPRPTAVAATRRRGMVITTAVSKGGTGKSTLTLNLAAYMGSRFKNANPSRSVCVIDANFQQADTGKYLGQYTPNIVNLIKDPSLMTHDRILSALVNRADMNFSALLGPATPDDALALLTAESGRGGTSFSARFYSEVLDLLKPHFDYIFIDTPVAEKYHSLFSEFALPKADFLIVPVIPSKQTVHNTYMWLNSAVIAPRHAQGAGMNPERVGIVLNRAEEGVGYGELEVMEELRKFNYLGAVPETIDWKRANNDGELIAAKNKSDINDAFARILGQVTGEPLLLNGLPTELTEERASIGDRLRSLFRGRE